MQQLHETRGHGHDVMFLRGTCVSQKEPRPRRLEPG